MLEMPSRIGPKKPVHVYLAAHREAKKLTQEQVGDRIGPRRIRRGNRYSCGKALPAAAARRAEP